MTLSFGLALPAQASPRPASLAEQAAIEEVLDALESGGSTLWGALAESAPLRALGREKALAEICLRIGPADGARWRLLTPAEVMESQGMGRRVVLFEIVDASGFEDTLRLILVPQEDGYGIEHIRTLIDPIDLEDPAHTLGQLLPLRRALAQNNDQAIRRLLSMPRQGEASRAQKLWATQFHLQSGELVEAARLLDPLTSATEIPLVEILTARLAAARRHHMAMEKAYARLAARGFDHDGLRLDLAQGRLHLGVVHNMGSLFAELDSMGSRLGEVAYGLARFGGPGGPGAGGEAPGVAQFAVSGGEQKLRIGGATFELPASFEDVVKKTREPRRPRATTERKASLESQRRAMPKVGTVPPRVVEAPDPQKIIQQRMPALRAWHDDYRQRVAPVKASLGPILGAVRGGEFQQLGGACRNLADHLTPLLGDAKVFAAPELDVESDLRRAFYHFQRMAGACLHGRLAEVNSEMNKAETKLRAAASALAPYGLRP